jgi:hypothetical protein
MASDIRDRMRDAKEERLHAEANTINVLLDAIDEGVPMLRISKEMGLARQTVYNLKYKFREL